MSTPYSAIEPKVQGNIKTDLGTVNILTQEMLKSVLDYDPDTGVFTWKEPRGGRGGNAAEGAVAGTIVRAKRKLYIAIGLFHKIYRAHRLAFLYVHGRFPSRWVDHRDGNGLNNRWRNLREATSSQNSCNAALRKDNKFGLKGVSFDKRTGKFRATVTHQGTVHHLGLFQAAEDAALAYKNAAERLHGEFARVA